MAYQIYIYDETEVMQLDTEDVDVTVMFSIADVADISTRKDNLTKHIKFKGTKTNNSAFGSLFHLNRVTNSANTNKILFNYNPLRTVDCFVLEDEMLIFKGSLRVAETIVDEKGIIHYSTVITGKLSEFRAIIQDRLLTDLDLESLKHHYNIDIITNSWATTIEEYNVAGNYFATSAFQLGYGYVYPFIDYGQMFKQTSPSVITDRNRWQVHNFRPAVYVKEIFNRIFDQKDSNDDPLLPGFTYEIKGSAAFLEKFNRLIIPNNEEKMIFKLSGFFTEFDKTTSENNTGHTYQSPGNQAKLLSLDYVTPPPSSSIAPYIDHYDISTRVLIADRSFTSDASAFVQFSTINNNTGATTEYAVAVVKRVVEENNEDPFSNWEVVTEKKFTVAPFATISNTVQLDVPETTWEERCQVAIRVRHQNIHTTGGSTYQTYTVTDARIRFPKDNLTQFKAEVKIGTGADADVIMPKLPENIKQIDFLKSLLNMFNIYVYTESSNPKHIIFQQYDDYYAYAAVNNLPTNALNWTNKIDYSKSLKIKSNLSLPKNYLFTFKDDSDYANKDYKDKYNIPYGSFHFTDAYGVIDSKKVELIFSPTPTVQYTDTLRLHPALYVNDNGQKKPTKTNIRILYYNGVKSCAEYTIEKDNYTTVWGTSTLATKPNYPMASSYLYSPISNLPMEDLHFGLPNEFYFGVSHFHTSANTLYQSHYINQLTELTNPNLNLIECNAWLNELDIEHLDLRTPIFIDMGDLGHSYFKVLSLEYVNKNVPTRLLLQKIFIGIES